MFGRQFKAASLPVEQISSHKSLSLMEPVYYFRTLFPRGGMSLAEKILLDWKWCPFFMEGQELRKNMVARAARANELRSAPAPKREKVEAITKAFSEHQKVRLEALQFRLGRIPGTFSDGRAKGFFDRLGSEEHGRPLPGFISLQEVIDLCENMPDLPGAISMDKRSKGLAEIKKEDDGDVEKLKIIDDPLFFRDTIDGKDCRLEFYHQWIRMQHQCSAPCNVFGYFLKRCGNAERSAWEVLELKKFVNKTGLEPYSF